MNGVALKVIDYGCTITSLNVPNRNGLHEDIVLGYDTLDEYIHSKHFLGCVIGRYANRIAHGKFRLDQNEYELAVNHPPHHLHGGIKGFDKVIWDAVPVYTNEGEGIEFYFISKDGEEGYPGNMKLSVRYLLSADDSLIIDYTAICDQNTIINLTQHSYFNLTGKKEKILSHQLQVNAHSYLPVDHTTVPTGEIKSVEKSPFDFRILKTIGNEIAESDAQLLLCGGYDHNWILSAYCKDLVHAATLYDPTSGRVMDVQTTEPGLQVYTGNFLDGFGKNNVMYEPYSGICLEPQHFPNSPNQISFPSTQLNVGDTFRSTTIFTFSTR